MARVLLEDILPPSGWFVGDVCYCPDEGNGGIILVNCVRGIINRMETGMGRRDNNGF